MVRLLALAIGLASLAISAPALAQSPAITLAAEATEAAKTVDAFHAALSRGDAAAATMLLVDDVIIFEAGGAERSKAEYASHHAGADAAYAAAVPSKLLRRTGLTRGDASWITSESRATGTYKDKAVDRVSTETMVLVRTEDGWRIAHIHWSSRPAS